MTLKVQIIGRRRPGMTVRDHRAHIRGVHGELILQFCRQDPAHAPTGYVQNVVVDGTFRATDPGADRLALERDYVTQLWFEDFDALNASRATPYYREILHVDEERFVDQPTVLFLPSSERVVQTSAADVRPEWKLFILLERGDGVDSETFTQAWESMSLPLAPTDAHCRNLVLPVPGQSQAVHAVDEFWTMTESAAHDLLSHYRALAASVLEDTGLLSPSGMVALVAREDVLLEFTEPA